MTSQEYSVVSPVLLCAAAFVACLSTRALADPVESELPAGGTDACVGFRDTGAFMTCWRMPVDEEGVYSPWRIVVQRYTAAGGISGSYDHVSADSTDTTNPQTYFRPSLFISRNGSVAVAWTAECRDCRDVAPGPLVLRSAFAYSSAPLPIGLPVEPVGPAHFVPSIGVSNAGETAVAYVAQTASPQGLLTATSVSGDDSIETCVDNPGPGQHYCFWTVYEPSISQRSDGKWAVVWSAPEDPTVDFTSFNIALRIYASDGTLLDQLDSSTTGWVNDPGIEQSASSQSSPAVDFDDDGNIVVAWVGPYLPSCTRRNYNIFARRLIYSTTSGIRDPNPAAGEGFAGEFVVDNDADADAAPLDQVNAHPAVALTRDTSRTGAFAIAFNT